MIWTIVLWDCVRRSIDVVNIFRENIFHLPEYFNVTSVSVYSINKLSPVVANMSIGNFGFLF